MNLIENMTNTLDNVEDLQHKYARVGLSPYIRTLFARTKARKAYKDRKEGAISQNVIDAVTNCINNRWLLNILYEPGPEEDIKPGRRWVEVYTYGLSKFTGNHLIRIFQYKGVTQTDQGWKLFRLDRCRSTAVSTKSFNKPRILFNPDGDADMSTIFLQVQFPNAQS